MIIALTGHTSGIGAALHNHLRCYHDVHGFCRTELQADGSKRSTGYDIDTVDGRSKIVNDSAMADVFINNASGAGGQSQLLFQMWDAWAATPRPRMIINIGSRAAVKPSSIPTGYDMDKQRLRNTSLNLSDRHSYVKVTHLMFGYVDVASVQDVQRPKLPVDEIVRMLNWVLAAPTSIQIREIHLDLKTFSLPSAD
jgi:NADP-dependent 3-hydroxy acid dehydrogenase YdfG